MSEIRWNFDLELCTESGSWMKQKVFFMWDKPKLIIKLKPRMCGLERNKQIRFGQWRVEPMFSIHNELVDSFRKRVLFE